MMPHTSFLMFKTSQRLGQTLIMMFHISILMSYTSHITHHTSHSARPPLIEEQHAPILELIRSTTKAQHAIHGLSQVMDLDKPIFIGHAPAPGQLQTHVQAPLDVTSESRAKTLLNAAEFGLRAIAKIGANPPFFAKRYFRPPSIPPGPVIAFHAHPRRPQSHSGRHSSPF